MFIRLAKRSRMLISINIYSKTCLGKLGAIRNTMKVEGATLLSAQQLFGKIACKELYFSTLCAFLLLGDRSNMNAFRDIIKKRTTLTGSSFFV